MISAMSHSIVSSRARIVVAHLFAFALLLCSTQPQAADMTQTITLKPGWNDLSISLQQAAASPRGRAMDMTSIKGFGLFVVKQQESIAIYLDHVYLE